MELNLIPYNFTFMVPFLDNNIVVQFIILGLSKSRTLSATPIISVVSRIQEWDTLSYAYSLSTQDHSNPNDHISYKKKFM